MTNTRLLFAGALAATVAAAACRDATGTGDRGRVDLFVAGARSAATASASRADATALRLITGNGHTLDLQFADLAVRDARLDRVDGREGEDSDSDGRHSDDVAIRTGPLTLALPLDGAITSSIGASIPFGRYDQLQAKLDGLRLRGTYDGQPFDTTIPLERKLRLRLSPPLVVDAANPNASVTLRADVAPCFVAADGTPIDPRRFQTEPALRASVRECIVRTLRARPGRVADDRDSDVDTDTDTDGDADTDTDH